MSSIFGIFCLNGGTVEEKHLQKMRDEMRRYGPDAQDILIDGNIALGCCLAKSGAYRQSDVPVYSDKKQGTMLVCDALIWNRAALAEELGLPGDISTQGLLWEAYEKWGEVCPEHINGDFAFAVWDKQKKHLFIARDHLGIRPLYYFFDGAIFAFATDYRAFLGLPFVGKQLDEVQVYASLSYIYHIDTEATFFEQVKRLPQAHTLLVEGTGIRKNKYWAPGEEKIVYGSEKEYWKKLYALIEDAVGLRVNGVAGKIGTEISGGLDSSVITVLVNRALAKKNQKLEELYSWSPPYTRMETQPKDEREQIEAVCRQEGLHCTYMDPSDPLYADMPAVQWLPETAVNGGEIFCRELKYLSSKDVKNIFSGWGGDEAASMRVNLYQILLQGYVGYYLKQARWLAKGSPWRFLKVIASSTVRQWFRPFSYFGNPGKDLPDILNKKFKKRMRRHCKKDILYFTVDAAKHIQYGVIQSRTELSAQLDPVFGVQHLYPYLDYRVVDFALSVPRYIYYKQGMNRYIFRKAFAGILPEQFNDYFIKDDPAKSAFLHQERAAENVEDIADKIDRELFAPYIDWDAFQRARGLSASASKNVALKTHLSLLKKLKGCFSIQQILKSV